MKVVLDGWREGLSKVQLIKLIKDRSPMLLGDALDKVNDLLDGKTIELEDLEDPMAFLPLAIELGAFGHILDGEVSMAMVSPPRDSVPTMPKLTDAEIHGACTTLAEAIAGFDPSFTWRLHKLLEKEQVAGPWEQHEGDDKWFHRKSLTGEFLARAWWSYEAGEITGARSQLCIGDKPAKLTASTTGYPITEYPTVAVAQMYLDTALRDAGYRLAKYADPDSMPPDQEATLRGLSRLLGRCEPRVAAGIAVGIGLRLLSPWHTSEGCSSIYVGNDEFGRSQYESTDIWTRTDSWGGVIASVEKHELYHVIEYTWWIRLSGDNYEGGCTSKEQGQADVDEKLRELGYYWVDANEDTGHGLGPGPAVG